MKDVVALRNLIQKRFDSESAAARSLGWPRQRLNRLTTGRRKPSISEARDLARLLSVDVGELIDIFLS